MYNKSKNFLAFNISMPDELIPLYDFLQSELNYFLSTKTYRNKLLKIDLSIGAGYIWKEMKDLFNHRIIKWPISNKAKYARMLYENLRRELESKQENLTIYNELKNNDFHITSELFDILVKQYNIYATKGRIQNIKSAKIKPELPYNAIFQMDYSTQDKQTCTKDEFNKFSFEIGYSNNKKIKPKTTWFDYRIYLPLSLNKQLTGCISKPRFFKRKSDGKYIGTCSYEYLPLSPLGNNILGVDVGRLKLYSCIVLKSNGEYSDEYINSKRCEFVKHKLNQLVKERKLLINKFKRSKKLNGIDTVTQQNRMKQIKELSNKITNIKLELSNLIAYEICETAYLNNCNEIHIENLSWLKSKAGKWNHSEMQNAIQNKSKQYGIKIIKINAKNTSKEHPITKEIGVINNRNVKFSDGEIIDRDLLAGINIAKRNKGNKRNNKIILKKKHSNPKRVITRSKKKEIREQIQKLKQTKNIGAKIVVYRPSVENGDKTNFVKAWSLIRNSVKLNTNNSFIYNKSHRCLHY